VRILTTDVNWQGVLKKKVVKQIQVKQWLGVHLKGPKTIATARIWGKLVPIIAAMSGECMTFSMLSGENNKTGSTILKEWTTPDSRNMPSTTNLEEEGIVNAPGNDGNASMLEQVKRPRPRKKTMIMMMKWGKPTRTICHIRGEPSAQLVPFIQYGGNRIKHATIPWGASRIPTLSQ
jgi:hypothetical protein